MKAIIMNNHDEIIAEYDLTDSKQQIEFNHYSIEKLTDLIFVYMTGTTMKFIDPQA